MFVNVSEFLLMTKVEEQSIICPEFERSSFWNLGDVSRRHGEGKRINGYKANVFKFVYSAAGKATGRLSWRLLFKLYCGTEFKMHTFSPRDLQFIRRCRES